MVTFTKKKNKKQHPSPCAVKGIYMKEKKEDPRDDEKRDDQALQRARVNRLFWDRRYHAHTASLMEGEARASRTAWAQSMDASDAARFGVITLRTQKMAPKRTTRANPFTTTTTTTTSVTNAQLEALIEQGVAKALAARDADRNTNDDDNHVSGTGGNATAPAKVHAVGHAGTNPDSIVVTVTFLLNNRYASILFDTGADRSFVSTAFSSQIAITPTTLDYYYDVELADARIIRGDPARDVPTPDRAVMAQ
nr:reverse transcriptase domain-containing protein [Tanacetum cinerariifolium]